MGFGRVGGRGEKRLLTALRGLLAGEELSIRYVPVAHSEGRGLLGFEARCRPGQASSLRTLPEAFALAQRTGEAALLDERCRQVVLADTPGTALSSTGLLFLPVHPTALGHRVLDGVELLPAVRAAALRPEQVVLTLPPAPGMPGLLDREAKRLSTLGFRLALGDVGSTAVGIRSLYDAPFDYAILSGGLVVRSVHDPRASGLLVAACTLALRAGAKLIVTGIDDARVFAIVRGRLAGAGVSFHGVQGAYAGPAQPEPTHV